MSKVCVVCVCDCVCLHSVLSDSLWLHGRHPARLLCPYNFTGKNTGVGCQFLLQEIFPTSPVRKEMYPQYRDWTHMYCVSLTGRFFTNCATWKRSLKLGEVGDGFETDLQWRNIPLLTCDWGINSLASLFPSLLFCWCMLVAQLCLILCYPMVYSPQAPLSMGFYRQEYCSGLTFPSPEDLPDPVIEPYVSSIGRQLLYCFFC